MKKLPKYIYLDYAATTPVDERVLEAMRAYFTDKFGNSSSMHQKGREALEALVASRQVLVKALGAETEEVIFTGSATESNNTVLKGLAFANPSKKHIVISSLEHDCVLAAAEWLEKRGYKLTKLPVDQYGQVNPKDLAKAIQKNTLLVSVMHANNEIGTIQDIKKIGEICRSKGVYFHTDASQTFGRMAIDVVAMNIDLLTASSHKIYGPKGVGLLYIKTGIKIEPLLHGGGHEAGLRSSTVNVGAIVGFAEAAKLALAELEEEDKRLTKLRDKLIKGILAKIPDSYLNGHIKNRLSNNVNVRFDYVEGEAIVMSLDISGIAGSTGSACSSKNLRASHVLLACGLPQEKCHGSLRLSLGRWTTDKDIDYCLKVLPGTIKKLREISPFYKR
jgi:cysteine desulfurase